MKVKKNISASIDSITSNGWPDTLCGPPSTDPSQWTTEAAAGGGGSITTRQLAHPIGHNLKCVTDDAGDLNLIRSLNAPSALLIRN